MQVKKTINWLAIVLALAQGALAEEIITENGFTTGTSFERLRSADLVAGRDDFGGGSGSNYWETTAAGAGESVAGTRIATYGTGEAYPYASTKRNKLFGSVNDKYLALDLGETLDRRMLLCTNASEQLERAHVLPWKLKDGLYADTLVKLTPCVSAPAVEDPDKVVVWLREGDCEGGTVTNLVVTAGRYAGGFDKIERCDYVVASPFVAADTWCRLTIRMIADVTGKPNSNGDVAGQKSAAFVVYVDGEQVCGDADYDVGTGYRADWMLPEVRLLVSERRLFPCLSPAGYDGATEVSRLSFDGQGSVDDVAVTTERPSHVVSDKVFTLKWDAGVKSMTCIVSNAFSQVTNEIGAADMPRFRDFTLKSGDYAQVTVTDVVYDTAHGYMDGLWEATNDCTVTGNVFTYDGKHANPFGYVASTRDVIAVGPGEGGVATFTEAKELARRKGVKTIALQSDTVVARGADRGCLTIEGDDDFVLDLCGHTLQGNGNPTVWQKGGKLRIMDSSDEKTGRILSATNDADDIAVQSVASPSSKPVLIIDAGWFDGFVSITNTQRGVALGACVVDGGSYTNVQGTTAGFYLEQYVTNATTYFGLSSDSYWTTVADGRIWTGGGTDARWGNAANWKGGEVPAADALAIFPRCSNDGGWAVDFGEGVEVKRFWLDADVAISGTNEFSDVAVVAGNGRIVGTGTVKFSGKLPGVLIGPRVGSEIRLGDGWQGTVSIAKITKAEPLANIMGWGNDRSRVEFAGVRGYLSDRANYAVPFGLVLTDADDGATPAWRNDTGYTGSTVGFPTLEGTGTFLSPKNTREILQVFQFRNVESFRGRFDLGGKRLVLGTGAAAPASGAGDYTFADAVNVRSGLGWKGVSAHFGSRLGVRGMFGEALLSYTGDAPDVAGVEVTLTDALGAQAKGRLAIDDQAKVVYVDTADALKVNGQSVSAMKASSAARDGSLIEVPVGSAVSVVGNDIVVNGMKVSTVAAYYEVRFVPETSAYAVSFKEEEVVPRLASFSVDSTEGRVVLQVTNAKAGLWYGLQTISSLAESWDSSPTKWRQAEGESVTFTIGAGESAGFYRVIMTDKDMNGGEE